MIYFYILTFLTLSQAEIIPNIYYKYLDGSSLINHAGDCEDKGKYSTTSFPPSRIEGGDSAFYISDDELIFLGGKGCDCYTCNDVYLSDVWQYNYTSKQFAWMKGDGYGNKRSVYGDKGVFSDDVIPGGRFNIEGFKVDDGDSFFLYVYGGYGYGESDLGYLNDLYVYDVNTTMFKFIHGSNETNQNGIYGGSYNDDNAMGARNVGSTSKVNKKETLFIGGFGFDESSSEPLYLNDFWLYDNTKNQFKFVKGSSTGNSLPVYGTEFNETNIIGGRVGQTSWKSDDKKNIFFFAGYGIDENGDIGYLNDLWQYRTEDGYMKYIKGSRTITDEICKGEYGTEFNDANWPPVRQDANDFKLDGYELVFWGGRDSNGFYNDYWLFDYSSFQWKYFFGVKSYNQTSKYPKVIYEEEKEYTQKHWPGIQHLSFQIRNTINENETLILSYGGAAFDENGEFGYINHVWMTRFVKEPKKKEQKGGKDGLTDGEITLIVILSVSGVFLIAVLIVTIVLIMFSLFKKKTFTKNEAKQLIEE